MKYKRRRNIKPRTMWTDADLRKRSVPAFVVWSVLQNLAIQKGSNYIHSSREELCELTRYVDPKTITNATGILQKAGWIKKSVHFMNTPTGPKKVFEIIIRKNKVLLKTSKTPIDFRVKGVSGVPRFQKPLKTSIKNKVKGVATTNDSLTERGARKTSPPPLSSNDGVSSNSAPNTYNTPHDWLAQDQKLRDEGIERGTINTTKSEGTTVNQKQDHPILKPMRLTESGWAYTDPPDHKSETAEQRINRIEKEKLEWAKFSRERLENATARMTI